MPRSAAPSRRFRRGSRRGAVGLVVIHDGARPLVDEDTITRTIEAARKHGGAIAALPVERPLAVVEGDVVTGRHDGRDLWRAQTPQAFAAGALLEAFRPATRTSSRAATRRCPSSGSAGRSRSCAGRSATSR
jgi:2-C-methyl-D-erythritol 4-phosphate cytidylyltransferase